MAEPLVSIERSRLPATPRPRATALIDVELEIEPGELIVLAGRSGSGKTTLLRACCGLVPHFHGGEVHGEVRGGRPRRSRARSGRARRRRGPRGAGPRDAGRVDHGARRAGAAARDPRRAARLHGRGRWRRWRSRSRSRTCWNGAVDTLSGGELQRVALAAALVGRPQLVLLDEPTSQLDPVAGDELIWLLRRLNEEWGTAVVLAEHRLERCLGAADRVLAMAGGRIAFDGSPRDLLRWALEHDPALATPAARAVRRWPGSAPPPVGVKDARGAPCAPLGIELARGRAGVAAASRTARRPAGVARPRSSCGTRGSSSTTAPGRATSCGASTSRSRRGERVALMGRNGAGKSTLLRAAAGRLEAGARAGIGAGRLRAAAQSPGDFLVRERVGDELPGEAGRGRARRRRARVGRATPTRATSRAASASGWRWRS